MFVERRLIYPGHTHLRAGVEEARAPAAARRKASHARGKAAFGPKIGAARLAVLACSVEKPGVLLCDDCTL